jgi:hypothetical protein
VPAENQNGLLIVIHKKWIHISLNRKTEDDSNNDRPIGNIFQRGSFQGSRFVACWFYLLGLGVKLLGGGVLTMGTGGGFFLINNFSFFFNGEFLPVV